MALGQLDHVHLQARHVAESDRAPEQSCQQHQRFGGNGETLRQLALANHGIVCLADFMTHEDRQRGDLVQIFVKETVEVLQPIHAVYYRNTQLAARIACFLDHVAEQIAMRGWVVC